MSRARLFGLLVVAVSALAVAFSASASAFPLPEILTSLTTFTGENTVANPKFESLKGNTFTCEKGKASGTLGTGKDKGEYHIEFFGNCKGTISGISFACNSLSDKEKVILVLGTYQIVVDEQSPVLGSAILLEVPSTHLNCGLALLVWKGSLLCLFEKPLEKLAAHVFRCEQSKGDPKETEYFNEKGEKVKIASFESSTNESAAEGAAEELSFNIKFAEAVEIMD